MSDKWIIEARNLDGSLNLQAPQPETVFGMGAIHGMSDWEMSRVIYAKLKGVEDFALTGDSIAIWPSLINPTWRARRKTW